ncbi:MAG: histone deacetylase [Pseudomonadota bacterium]
MLPIVYHPHYQIPLRKREEARVGLSKYGHLKILLEREGLLAPGGYPAPAEATERQLSLAHDPDYVARVLDLRLTEAETRAIGLPNHPDVARRSRLTSSGSLLAAWLAMESGIACNAAGGSHHAAAGRGAGFCVFNDVAVAAANLLAQGVPGPILIVDADVHQGDGTARIFADEPRVFTLSVHAARNFPARKATSDLDIALDDGTGDTAFREALAGGLAKAIEACRPNLAFYNAGVDVWGEDRLGRLALSLDGIRARDRLVLTTLRQAGIPVACVLGGGYGETDEVAGRHLILFQEAARLSGSDPSTV